MYLKEMIVGNRLIAAGKSWEELRNWQLRLKEKIKDGAIKQDK